MTLVNSSKRTLRVGIVGAGYVSTYHIRACQGLEGVEVVGLADPNVALAREVASKFQIPAVYPSLTELGAVRPDVIHVLTPPALHARLAMEALEMGCHVLVEKPMAESVADCDRMIEAAREKGLVLSVNHSARFDPVILEALERLPEIGEVIAADFFRSSDYPPYLGGPMPAPYRKGSYPFQDLGVHGLYLLEAFLGPAREARVEYRTSGRDLNLVFDEWRATVESERGIGRMHLSWNVRPIQNQLLIQGTKGVMVADCFLQTCVVRKAWPAPRPVQWILNAELNSLATMWRSAVNLLRFATKRLRPSPGIFAGVEAFYAALQAGAEPPVTAEEGRRMIALMEDVSARADADRAAMLQVPQPGPARILVTGAGGFLGRALMRRLKERGESVRVLVRRRREDPLEIPVVGDLGYPEVVEAAVAGVETVFHVGAAMKGSAGDFQRGTVAGTRNIVESCLKHGVKKLVYVSSLSVFDHAGRAEGQVVAESSPYEPYPDRRGAYTQTKLEAERLVLEAARDRGLNVVVLRPGQIFGPGAEATAPAGTIGLAGRWIVVGDGTRKLPLVYVDDVADAMILAAERDVPPGSVFNLVDATEVTQRQFVAAAKTGPVRTPPALFVPEFVMNMMAFGVEMLGKVLKRNVPLTRYRVASIRPLWPVDGAAARDVLGWTPRVGVAEGLKRTFR
jgi:predicted dehydrogenase/nucleoside-diphosphate-sugar epimerase